MQSTVFVMPSVIACGKCGYLMQQIRPRKARERFALIECGSFRCVMRGKQIRFPLTAVKCAAA